MVAMARQPTAVRAETLFKPSVHRRFKAAAKRHNISVAEALRCAAEHWLLLDEVEHEDAQQQARYVRARERKRK